MPSFELNRTGDIPVRFTGKKLGSSASKNSTTPSRETSSRQWFELDVYRTAGGTFIAHVKYRAGSRLAREEACDMTFTAPDGETLLETLKAIDPVEEFVCGWPGNGEPADNFGRDFRTNDASVCRFACSEFENLIENSAHLFGAVEEIA